VNCVVRFCRTPPVATDSLAYTARHVPDTGGRFGSVVTGLWQRRTGRPPAYLVRRLQSVLNASAWMTFQLRRSDHITDPLAWLRVPEHIQFKIAVLAYKDVHRRHCVTWVCSSVFAIYRFSILTILPELITWSCHHSNCPLVAVEDLRLLLLRNEMCSQRTNIVTNVTHFS